MAEQKIEFRKVRDFSENLNDTFQFIRFNFGPLLKSFFAICAIFMLSQSILEGVYRSRFASVWASIFKARYSGAGYSGQFFGAQYFILLLLQWLSYASMQVAVGAYIKFYIENDGRKPSIEEVWKIFRKYFFKILLFSVPVGLSIIVGTVLCLVPGVYMWVVLVPFSMVAIMEETDFQATYYRCFDLIKDNFWMSFGIYLVSLIIYYLFSLFIGLIVSVIFGLAAYLTTKDLGTTIGTVTSFLSIFSLSFYIIFMISVAFQYFTLAEMKDSTGILHRIGNLGKTKDDFDNIEEQY